LSPTVLDLFSGIGGFSLGLERAGMKTVAFCEIDEAARLVLKKHWPDVPIYNDVRDVRAGGEKVDVICGGFPCQDISVGHTWRAAEGLDGERSGLWWEFHRIIAEFAPSFAVIENVAALRSRGLDQVLRSLAEIGYDAEWHCIPAAALGAAHQRDRIWVIAYPASLGVERLWPEGIEVARSLVEPFLPVRDRDGQWQVEPDLRRSPYGLSSRLDGRVNRWGDRVKQLGNAVCPQIPQLIGARIVEHLQGNQ
jgi:DNA (cytosine-5)-methyltransferase 1